MVASWTSRCPNLGAGVQPWTAAAKCGHSPEQAPGSCCGPCGDCKPSGTRLSCKGMVSQQNLAGPLCIHHLLKGCGQFLQRAAVPAPVRKSWPVPSGMVPLCAPGLPCSGKERMGWLDGVQPSGKCSPVAVVHSTLLGGVQVTSPMQLFPCQCKHLDLPLGHSRRALGLDAQLVVSIEHGPPFSACCVRSLP